MQLGEWFQRRKRYRILATKLTQYWLMPGLLIAIALRQLVMAHTVGLSAWHGGGFGMFASIDRDERRVIEIWLQDDTGQRFRVDLSQTDAILPEQDLIRTRTLPIPQHLMAIADELIDLPWEAQDDSDTVKFMATISPDRLPLQLESITVQVLRLEYDPASQRMWYRPVGPAIEVFR